MGLDSIYHLISGNKTTLMSFMLSDTAKSPPRLGGPGISWVRVGLVDCATCHLWVTGLAHNGVHWEAREEGSAQLLLGCKVSSSNNCLKCKVSNKTKQFYIAHSLASLKIDHHRQMSQTKTKLAFLHAF